MAKCESQGLAGDGDLATRDPGRDSGVGGPMDDCCDIVCVVAPGLPIESDLGLEGWSPHSASQNEP